MNRLWIWTLLRLRALAGDERGVNLVEYALLVAVAILLVLVAVRNFSNAFIEAANFISTEIDAAVNPT
ncbi:MAG: Flp family type IVb pilin [bacterium]